MKKAVLLSNITTDLIVAKLRRQYEITVPEGYDTWVQEVLNAASFLYTEKHDAVLILLDGTEAAEWRSKDQASERTELWKDAVSILAERITDIPVFVSTIDFRLNRIRALSEKTAFYALENSWYEFCTGLCSAHENFYVMDLADLIYDSGRNHFYSDKMWYMSSMPYSREGLTAVASFLKEILDAAFLPRKKMAVLDLDNTLWGGVIGEDGIEGIELSEHKEGQRFYDFQRQLLEMKKRGVILGIDSKNNPEDAGNAIQNHPSMLLRDEDFVIRKINWNDKASNIKEICEDLNLTEGGLVFIDDNPIERETVKGECPEVLVPDFPEDSADLKKFAEALWFREMRPLRILAEDRDKTRMYQKEAARKEERKSALNLDDYISRLEVRLNLHVAKEQELERVTQLCNKTNQFNLTTKRYTKAEIDAMAASSDSDIYVAYASDKYGDSGLIGVLIMKNEDENARIDSFLMSCRVMGRKIEEMILQKVIERYASCKEIRADYVKTAKNAPVEDLYERCGFRLVKEEEGHKAYELTPSDYPVISESLFKEVVFE